MNLNDIFYDIFRIALPTDRGLSNWKPVILLIILYYDVFCNRYNLAYKQTDVYIIIDFLYETMVFWFKYWCWVYKISNNNYIVALIYIESKNMVETIRNSFSEYPMRLEFVSDSLPYF